MTRDRHAKLALGIALAMLAMLPAGVTGQTYDEGRLVPSWFGDQAMTFVQTEEIDYLWVADGFELQGKTLHWKPWPEPEKFLGEAGDKRDENDYRLARQLAGEMARSFVDTFNRELARDFPSSLEEGDILVEGRIVDCSTGSRAAKALVGFGAGAGNTAIDVRFTDKASGKVVMALHHRVVSGTNWSTTDSKFFKWVKKMGKELADDGVQELYRDGKRRKD